MKQVLLGAKSYACTKCRARVLIEPEKAPEGERVLNCPVCETEKALVFQGMLGFEPVNFLLPTGSLLVYRPTLAQRVAHLWQRVRGKIGRLLKRQPAATPKVKKAYQATTCSCGNVKAEQESYCSACIREFESRN